LFGRSGLKIQSSLFFPYEEEQLRGIRRGLIAFDGERLKVCQVGYSQSHLIGAFLGLIGGPIGGCVGYFVGRGIGTSALRRKALLIERGLVANDTRWKLDMIEAVDLKDAILEWESGSGRLVINRKHRFVIKRRGGEKRIARGRLLSGNETEINHADLLGEFEKAIAGERLALEGKTMEDGTRPLDFIEAPVATAELLPLPDKREEGDTLKVAMDSVQSVPDDKAREAEVTSEKGIDSAQSAILAADEDGISQRQPQHVPSDNERSSINRTQRLILAVAVPLFVIVVTLGAASSIGGRHGPFWWERTWIGWVTSIGLVTIFEFVIFADRSRRTVVEDTKPRKRYFSSGTSKIVIALLVFLGGAVSAHLAMKIRGDIKETERRRAQAELPLSSSREGTGAAQEPDISIPFDQKLKIKGKAGISDKNLRVDLYNGSSWTVTGVTVAVTIAKKALTQEEQRIFDEFKSLSTEERIRLYDETLSLKERERLADIVIREKEPKFDERIYELSEEGYSQGGVPYKTTRYSTSLGYDLREGEDFTWNIKSLKGLPPKGD
jgi:hypothetical protein